MTTKTQTVQDRLDREGQGPQVGDVLVKRLGKLKPRYWLVVGVGPLLMRYHDEPAMKPYDFAEADWGMYGILEAEYGHRADGKPCTADTAAK